MENKNSCVCWRGITNGFKCGRDYYKVIKTPLYVSLLLLFLIYPVSAINDAGLSLIKKYEGCRLIAYKCPAGVLTIGYGHTGKDVYAGKKITQKQADELFKNDLLRYENTVRKATKGLVLNENKIAALTSLCYNIGQGAFVNSSLQKRLHVPNTYRWYLEALWYRWVWAKGQKLPGLVKRRYAEIELYFTPIIPKK